MRRTANRCHNFGGHIGGVAHCLLCGDIPVHYAWDISCQKSHDEVVAICFGMCIRCLASESATVTESGSAESDEEHPQPNEDLSSTNRVATW